MKKTFFVSISVLVAIGLVWFVFAGGGEEKDQSSEKLKVAATIFPAYDIARNIAGDAAEVELVLPPNASPHTYEPSPQDVARLARTKAIFVIGAGLDAWADTFAETAGVQKISLEKDIPLREFGTHEHDEPDQEGEGERHNEREHAEGNDGDHDEHGDAEHEDDHAHGGNDPHYWLSVQNAKIMAGAIADALVSLDPENESAYRENLEVYRAELDRLDQDIQDILGTLDRRHIIVFHESFGYFTDAYGLSIVGVFEVSPGVEPSPQQIREIIERVEEYDVPVLYTEPQLAQETLHSVARDVGVPVEILDPLGGVPGRDSYISLMRHNTTVLFESLK